MSGTEGVYTLLYEAERIMQQKVQNKCPTVSSNISNIEQRPTTPAFKAASKIDGQDVPCTQLDRSRLLAVSISSAGDGTRTHQHKTLLRNPRSKSPRSWCNLCPLPGTHNRRKSRVQTWRRGTRSRQALAQEWGMPQVLGDKGWSTSP